MTIEQVLFWIFAISACGGAIAVAVSQNVVRMAFWLIVSLGSTAALFFLLRADFVGATQLLIYVGGTVVLLIFGVMLTASGPYMRFSTSPGEGLLGAGVGVLFLGLLVWTVGSVDWQGTPTARVAATATGYADQEIGSTARPLGFALLGLRPDRDLGRPEGSTLSTGYLLPFEIASIHLLVVLIGAAYLARAKRRRTEADLDEV